MGKERITKERGKGERNQRKCYNKRNICTANSGLQLGLCQIGHSLESKSVNRLLRFTN